MAYTYTSSVNSTGNSAIKFRMGYEVVSQGIVENEPQSVINVVLQAERTNTSTTNKQSAATTMTIDGTAHSKSLNFNVGGYTQNTWYTIWTISNTTITHNSSTGAKSISLAFTINLSGTSASSGSGSWSNIALPTIPMGSTLSLNASSYTISSSNPTVTATITKYNTAYYHKLFYYLGSTQITSQSVTASSTNPQTKTYTMTATAWLPNMPNVTSATGSCILRTYSDSGYTTQVGVDSTVSFTVVCTKAPTATLTVATSGGISGYWISGFTSAALSASATAADTGSSIKKYEYLIDGSVAKTNTVSGATTNSWTSGVLSAGTHSFSVRVTDSRGLTGTSTATSKTVQSYSNPNISNISIFRSNGSATPTNDGTYIYVKATATASATGNSISTFKCFIKASTASSWGTAKTPFSSGTASEFSGYSATTSYNVKLEATDLLGVTSTYTTTIQTASYTMDFKAGGLGIGVGKVAEEDNLLDSAWDIKSAGNIRAEGQFRGKDVNSYAFGKMVLVPTYSFSNLGVSSGIGITYFTAWIKKVCEVYPSLTNTVFYGCGYPGTRGVIMWLCYNTGDVDANGVPTSSTGMYVPYGSGNTKTHYFGTASNTVWYSAGDVVTSGAQTFDGDKTFAGYPRIANDDENPAILFASKTSDQRIASIFMGNVQTGDVWRANRFYVRVFSYDSATGATKTQYENYRFPVVTADRTSSTSYDVLTNKSKVTIAQGGTGQGAPSTVTTGIVSSVDGATLSVQKARVWGKCCDLYLEFNAGTVAGGSSITATVASGYIPALAASGCAYWNVSPFIAQLDSSGNLNIRNASGTSRTFSSTYPLRIALSYQIA